MTYKDDPCHPDFKHPKPAPAPSPERFQNFCGYCGMPLAECVCEAFRPATAPSSSKRCPNCDGKGKVTKLYDDYGMLDPKDVRCPICEGSGRVQPA